MYGLNQLKFSHNLNGKLILDTLEFRRIEYQTYLSEESPDFLAVMDRTLANYSNYIMNDINISTEQKQHYLKDVNKINQAVIARKKLTEKLLNYERKRSLYLNQTKYNNVSGDMLNIIEKPFLIPENE